MKYCVFYRKARSIQSIRCNTCTQLTMAFPPILGLAGVQVRALAHTHVQGGPQNCLLDNAV